MRIFLCGDVMTGRGIDQALPHPCSPILHEAMFSRLSTISALPNGQTVPCRGLRIPTEPATYSDLNPATLIDAAPVGLWARRPSSIATLNYNGSALSTSPQAGRELPC